MSYSTRKVSKCKGKFCQNKKK